MSFKDVPVATYRLQLNQDFPFSAAAQLVPYLAELGISTLYLSPILQARTGSQHGYDVCDPTQIDDDRGGEEGFRQLVEAVQQHGMTILADAVPNHMAVSSENPWWLHVLESGSDAPEAEFFDIDWEPSRSSLTGKVLLPVLGQPYVDALNAGELTIEHEAENAWVRYFDWKLPISQGAESKAHLERLLAAQDEDEIPQVQRQLLDNLLEAQCYRLAFWRSASAEINYRRFFDIADLAGLRQELDVVFESYHQRLIELIREGSIAGLRIDHVDGLRDPRGYLLQLRDQLRADPERRFYIVVEKIIEAQHEDLPEDWPVAGTTGYEAISYITGLLADEAGMPRLTRLYQDLTGDHRSFEELVYDEKLRIVERLFAADLGRLLGTLVKAIDQLPAGRDIPRRDLRAAVVELTATLPVYRTYLDSEATSGADLERISSGVSQALERRPDLERPLRLIRQLFLGEVVVDERTSETRVEAIARWQQLTGAVMAKGLEDTSLYVDTRLVSLNEVGGGPQIIAIGPEQFHRWAERRARDWPTAMSTLSTHDSKRSEDVRSRINVLSELPDEWERHFRRWWDLSKPARTTVDGIEAPDVRDGLLIFQTLLGVWPTSDPDLESLRDRVSQYLTKAAREAKRRTSWQEPNEQYEDALRGFAISIVDPQFWPELFDDFLPFQQRIAWLGALSSLSQTLLKLTIPGVPDFYQGTELWSLNLVDPDNRRPVDYERRRNVLEKLEADQPSLDDLLGRWQSGEVKLDLVRRLLTARHQYCELFTWGSYHALQVEGSQERHIVAFARDLDSQRMIVVVPRFFAALDGQGDDIWDGTSVRLPDGWAGQAVDAVTGAELIISDGALPIKDIHDRFPWACLILDEP